MMIIIWNTHFFVVGWLDGDFWLLIADYDSMIKLIRRHRAIVSAIGWQASRCLFAIKQNKRWPNGIIFPASISISFQTIQKIMRKVFLANRANIARMYDVCVPSLLCKTSLFIHKQFTSTHTASAMLMIEASITKSDTSNMIFYEIERESNERNALITDIRMRASAADQWMTADIVQKPVWPN